MTVESLYIYLCSVDHIEVLSARRWLYATVVVITAYVIIFTLTMMTTIHCVPTRANFPFIVREKDEFLIYFFTRQFLFPRVFCFYCRNESNTYRCSISSGCCYCCVPGEISLLMWNVIFIGFQKIEINIILLLP